MKILLFIKWMWNDTSNLTKVWYLWLCMFLGMLSTDKGTIISMFFIGATLILGAGILISAMWGLISYQWDQFNKEELLKKDVK